MSAQFRLVIEDGDDALGEAVRALGGHKVVGPMLWPDKSPEASARLLADCLNSNRAEKLDFTQVVFVLRKSREAGYHGAKHWFDHATGYQPSEPMEPEDERARLQRAYIESVAQQRLLIERMERLAR